MGITRKSNNHRQQTNPQHREEETQNTNSHTKAKKQLKQSNQLSLPQQDNHRPTHGTARKRHKNLMPHNSKKPIKGKQPTLSSSARQLQNRPIHGTVRKRHKTLMPHNSKKPIKAKQPTHFLSKTITKPERIPSTTLQNKDQKQNPQKGNSLTCL